MDKKFVPPSFKVDAFHCPHSDCETYAHQIWLNVAFGKHTHSGHVYQNSLDSSTCSKCGEFALWYQGRMLFPKASSAPSPMEDMPDDVKTDFIEAGIIVDDSSRAAAALLRLSLQKLMTHLGESGKDLNDDIANLVKKGLHEKIQKALDSVRVIGNNAVHPGKIDLKDDKETAIALFGLLNMIIDIMITQPKDVDEIYKKIPKGAKDAITKRDKK